MRVMPVMGVCKFGIITVHTYATHGNKEGKLLIAHVKDKRRIAVIVSM